MSRHDPSLSRAVAGRAALVSGLFAATPLCTPFGWVPLSTLSPGDLVLSGDRGLVVLDEIRAEPQAPLWSVEVTAGALGNGTTLLLPPGQAVLVETAAALPYTGEPQALVPAAALEGWRGIALRACVNPEPILKPRLARPGLLMAGSGLIVGVGGNAPHDADVIRRLLAEPARPVLPLAAARHLLAVLMGQSAGAELAAVQAARDWPEKRV